MKLKTPAVKYKVPALDKALDILEYLAMGSSPLPLSTIAKDLNKTASEVFRVINCLVKRNYIVKDSTVNAYSLSLKFFELTNNIPPLKRLIDASTIPLTRLVKEIGFSCHLSILEGGDLVILHEQEGTDPVHVRVKAGARIPATHTSSGRLLLACLEEKMLVSALAQDSYYMGNSPAVRKEIRSEIEALRGKTSSVSKSKQHPAVYDIVSPIEMYRHRFAALGAPIFLFTYDDERVKNFEIKVRDAAEKIQKDLGAV
jgi:DNA-binding IclR family transcriptional regulator